MNILLISEYYPPYIGGVEVVMKNIAERLSDRGHDVTVLTTMIEGSDAREVRGDVEIHRVRTPEKADRFLFSLAAIPKAVSLAREADVIHTTTWFGPFPSSIAKIVTNTPMVVTFHESLSEAYRRSSRSRISLYAASLFESTIAALPVDMATAVSRHTRQEIREKQLADDTKVVYNGVDNNLFSSENPNPYLDDTIDYRFLFFGRPGFSKGVNELIDAFKRFTRFNPDRNVELYLLLSPEPRDNYEEILDKISKSGLDNINVNDPVERSELPGYIEHADCVVIPSLSEGFGFTTAEACSVGTPVITTTAGSLPEVISGQHIMVPPQDVDDLAVALINAYNGKFDNIKQKKFDWFEAVNSYLQLYRELTGDNENRD